MKPRHVRQWVVYMLRMRDNSLYCGITNDFDRRLKAHKAKKGSKYVASRLPVLEHRILLTFCPEDSADPAQEAARAEAYIKGLSKPQKEEWMAGNVSADLRMLNWITDNTQ